MPHEITVIAQPVLDAAGRPIGHDVRFGGPRAPVVDGEAATSLLLLSLFGGFGAAAPAGHTPVWLPVSPAFLADFGPPPARPDRVVLQLAEIPVAGRVLDAVARAARLGYAVALDGFAGSEEAVLSLCSTVKVDVRGLDEARLRSLLAAGRAAGVEVVATGLVSAEEHRRARALGYDAFQGAAVAPSSVVRRRLAGVCSAEALEVLRAAAGGGKGAAASAGAAAGFGRDLGRIVAEDAGLALTLLRYAGSAYAAPPTLRSPGEALELLGPRAARRLAALVAAAVPPQPREALGELALRRARACEAASGATDPAVRASYFTVGLLSVASELAGAPLDEVAAALPLAPDVRTALLARAGPKGERLATVLRYERAAA